MSENADTLNGALPRERVMALVARVLDRAPDAATLPRNARLNELGVSSMKLITLMLAIEVEFDLTIPQAQITPENFDSIASVEALVIQLLGSTPAV